MASKITRLDKLQKELEQARRAFGSLEGEVAALRFNPSDAASVEEAIADMEQAVDGKLMPYRGSTIVMKMADELKTRYRNYLLQCAVDARSQKETPVNQMDVDQDVLRQIENVVIDLQWAEPNSFGRHIKKLSRLLHSPSLDHISRGLTEGLDLDPWLEAGRATLGSMAGSAELEWPNDTRQELGTIILLIDRFAGDPEEAKDFAHTFYHRNNNIADSLHLMTEQVITPFARDYINHVKADTRTAEATMSPVRNDPASRKVFVVHGHDEAAREMVGGFLYRIGCEAIILHQRTNRGRTIIEKFEANSDVGFAVILLTPDDVGAKAGEQPLNPRPRQNVILEWGYFIGKLGRDRVCALKKGNVELPSDTLSIVWEPLDEHGAWKTKLARELAEAEFEIDWEKVSRG